MKNTIWVYAIHIMEAIGKIKAGEYMWNEPEGHPIGLPKGYKLVKITLEVQQ